MYIWKINGMPDGIWVKSEKGTNFDLIPEGDSIRVMNIDSLSKDSFSINDILNVENENDNIVITTEEGRTTYSLGLNTNDLKALNGIESDIRHMYLSCITENACLWLKNKLGM